MPFWLYSLPVLITLGTATPSRAAAPFPDASPPTLILVAGAPGEQEYGSNFLRQVDLWTATAARAQVKALSIGLDAPTQKNDRERLRELLSAQLQETNQPLWVVFIGHGTFDGAEARFNLRGPDVSATEMADWLRPLRRPLVFIDTTSASAPFLNKLSGTNRVIITATRSGNEQNFARFGEFFAEALKDADSDLDKDGQVSLLEAFLSASARVAEFYKTERRLATEHALLDDNGDGLGTPADWFRGVRAIKKAEGTAGVDGARAHQIHLVLSEQEQALPADVRARRDAVELSIARLRETKSQRPEAEYYRELEKLLNQLLDAYGDRLQ